MNKMKHVNPVHLADKQVKVKFRALGGLVPAMIEKKHGRLFEITVDKSRVLELAESIEVSPAVVTLGVMYHEVAHLRYDSFSGNWSTRLHKYVDNIIEDSRIEYLMSFDYPYVAKYIALALASLRKTVMESEVEVEDDIIQKLTSALYDYVRFGFIDETVDSDFINFMCPRVTLARRSNRAKAKQIVDEIANYITICSKVTNPAHDTACSVEVIDIPKNIQVEESEHAEEDEEQFETLSDEELVNEESTDGDGVKDNQEDGESQNEKNVGEDDSDNVCENNQDGEPESVDKTVEEMQKEIVQNLKEQVEDIENGFGVGAAEVVIADVVEVNDYFRTVVTRNKTTVKQVNKAFKNIFTKIINVPMKEGDINIKKMQDAYYNSVIGEEAHDYFIQKRAEAKFDCVIVRDISGSTEYVRDKYAKAVCVLAKSLSEIADARLAVIDFNENAHITLPFDSPIEKASIVPRSCGGTSFYNACVKVSELDFKNKLRIAIVITDGQCYDYDMVARFIKNLGIEWFPIFFNSSYGGYTANIIKAFGDVECVDDIHNLHKAVLSLIKRRLKLW